MKLTIENRALRIEAETPADVREVIEHFKLDPFAHTEAMATGRMVYTKQPSARDNSAHFPVSHTVGVSFVRPYLERLAKITGRSADDVPTIDPAARYESHHVRNLQYTHVVTHARLDADGYHFTGIQHSQDWNGDNAEKRAPRLFAEYVTQALGHVKREPEFIEVGHGGLLRRNPNYLRNHAPTPRAESLAVWACIWQWWLDNCATEGQKTLIVQAAACHRSVCRNERFSDYLARSYDNGFRTAWDQPVAPYADFQKL